MKVQKISEISFKSRASEAKENKQDLTSFGVDKVLSLNDKKANDAIKTNFLSKVSFKGHVGNFVFCEYRSSGDIRLDTEDGCGQNAHCGSTYATNESRIEAIKKSPSYFVNSEIERVSNPTNSNTHGGYKVYFLDPEEVIKEEDKKQYGYIVSDNEPKVPRLDYVKSIFQGEHESDGYSYGQLHFKTKSGILLQVFRDRVEYFMRLEDADSKTLDEKKASSDEKQKSFEIAERNKRFYEEKVRKLPWKSPRFDHRKEKAEYYYGIEKDKNFGASQLVEYYKARVENARRNQDLALSTYSLINESKSDLEKIAELKANYWATKHVIDNNPRYIANDKQSINEKNENIKKYTKEKNVTQDWLKMNEEEASKISDYNKEEKLRKQQELESLKRKIADFEAKIKDCRERISYYESDIKALEKAYEQAKKQLPSIEKSIKEVQSKLNSAYAKIEKFYKTNYPTCC